MPAILKIVRLVYLYPLQTSPEFLNLWSLCNLVELFRHVELMFGFYQYGSRHVFLFKYFVKMLNFISVSSRKLVLLNF